jgi:hypothetical protein
LLYDIEVVSINAAPPEKVEGNLFAEIDTDGNGELDKSEIEAYFKSIHKCGNMRIRMEMGSLLGRSSRVQKVVEILWVMSCS